MATANVTFLTVGGPSGAISAFNGVPLEASQDVASGAASTASPRECWCRVYTTGAMRVLFSQATSPTAASTDMYVNGAFEAWVPAGTKVAVLDA